MRSCSERARTCGMPRSSRRTITGASTGIPSRVPSRCASDFQPTATNAAMTATRSTTTPSIAATQRAIRRNMRTSFEARLPVDLELKNKIAVITGCSVGLGRGIATMLAAEGAQTVVIARRRELLASLCSEIEAAGGLRPLSIPIDLAERSAADAIKNSVLGAFGTIDILVNNAGGSRPVPFDAPDDVWDETFALNFTAVRKLTQAFLPAMLERRAGRIVIVTGTREPLGVNAANAAKDAVHGWAKGLSRDVGKFGITVNCIIPGRIHSEQIDQRLHPTPESQAEFTKNIPAGYFGQPEDLAFTVAMLCSPKARYVNGVALRVDGGLHRFL